MELTTPIQVAAQLQVLKEELSRLSENQKATVSAQQTWQEQQNELHRAQADQTLLQLSLLKDMRQTAAEDRERNRERELKRVDVSGEQRAQAQLLERQLADALQDAKAATEEVRRVVARASEANHMESPPGPGDAAPIDEYLPEGFETAAGSEADDAAQWRRRQSLATIYNWQERLSDLRQRHRSLETAFDDLLQPRREFDVAIALGALADEAESDQPPPVDKLTTFEQKRLTRRVQAAIDGSYDYRHMPRPAPEPARPGHRIQQKNRQRPRAAFSVIGDSVGDAREPMERNYYYESEQVPPVDLGRSTRTTELRNQRIVSVMLAREGSSGSEADGDRQRWRARARNMPAAATATPPRPRGQPPPLETVGPRVIADGMASTATRHPRKHTAVAPQSGSVATMEVAKSTAVASSGLVSSSMSSVDTGALIYGGYGYGYGYGPATSTTASSEEDNAGPSITQSFRPVEPSSSRRSIRMPTPNIGPPPAREYARPTTTTNFAKRSDGLSQPEPAPVPMPTPSTAVTVPEQQHTSTVAPPAIEAQTQTLPTVSPDYGPTRTPAAPVQRDMRIAAPPSVAVDRDAALRDLIEHELVASLLGNPPTVGQLQPSSDSIPQQPKAQPPSNAIQRLVDDELSRAVADALERAREAQQSTAALVPPTPVLPEQTSTHTLSPIVTPSRGTFGSARQAEATSADVEAAAAAAAAALDMSGPKLEVIFAGTPEKSPPPKQLIAKEVRVPPRLPVEDAGPLLRTPLNPVTTPDASPSRTRFAEEPSADVRAADVPATPTSVAPAAKTLVSVAVGSPPPPPATGTTAKLVTQPAPVSASVSVAQTGTPPGPLLAAALADFELLASPDRSVRASTDSEVGPTVMERAQMAAARRARSRATASPALPSSSAVVAASRGVAAVSSSTDSEGQLSNMLVPTHSVVAGALLSTTAARGVADSLSSDGQLPAVTVEAELAASPGQLPQQWAPGGDSGSEAVMSDWSIGQM